MIFFFDENSLKFRYDSFFDWIFSIKFRYDFLLMRSAPAKKRQQTLAAAGRTCREGRGSKRQVAHLERVSSLPARLTCAFGWKLGFLPFWRDLNTSPQRRQICPRRVPNRVAYTAISKKKSEKNFSKFISKILEAVQRAHVSATAYFSVKIRAPHDNAHGGVVRSSKSSRSKFLREADWSAWALKIQVRI